MIIKFKIFENVTPIDPYGEEDWDDTDLFNKSVKILEIRLANGIFRELMLCKVIATKEIEYNTLTFRYINEYDNSLSVPIGRYCIHWGVDYIIVDDFNNVEQYVNEMREKIGNSGGGLWCFVFDKDTPNDIILEYAKLLYPKDKVRIVKHLKISEN